MMDASLFIAGVLIIIAAWLPIGRKGRVLIAAGVAVVGFSLELISLTALLALAALSVLVWHAKPERHVIVGLIFATVALAFGFGLISGFDAVLMIENEIIKPASEPYARGVTLGLVAISLLLLAMHPLANSLTDIWRAVRIGVLVGLVSAVPALGAGVMLGGLSWSPGYPAAHVMAIWLGGQVLTLAMEEGFFRGFLQHHLSRHAPAALAVVIAGLLFGLAHFAGGMVWTIGASLAGIGYGMAYQLSGGRLEASMAAHLTVNLLHIGLFSYPMLA